MSTKKQRKGVPLKAIHFLLVFTAVLLSGLIVYSSSYLSASFKSLTDVSERNIELRKAALELMDASDYLTERVQRFAISGDMKYLQEYYNEAFVLKRRDEAINKMSAVEGSAAALESLQNAMEGSQRLMETEYYAFRLVLEAKGYTDESTYSDYPLPLQDVVLSAEDEALSPDEKMRRATEMVFDDHYYHQKKQIRDNMQASLDELEKLVNKMDAAAIEDMRTRLIFLRVVVAIETLGVFLLVWLASHLGINPIVSAVERIKNNSKIPEAGTREFRYLVRAYNQMYELYRNSLERLDFKASHDELTGVYNRAGYESLLSSIELGSTYMLLFDVDNFKNINDTFGHKVGDKVLIEVVKVLQSHFRPEDFICRLGGDEFIVLMLHTSVEQRGIIAAKIDDINKELSKTDNGLPPTSVSAGIVHGSEADKIEDLFIKTDVAMYRSKQRGKNTYTFYSV